MMAAVMVGSLTNLGNVRQLQDDCERDPRGEPRCACPILQPASRGLTRWPPLAEPIARGLVCRLLTALTACSLRRPKEKRTRY